MEHFDSRHPTTAELVAQQNEDAQAIHAQYPQGCEHRLVRPMVCGFCVEKDLAALKQKIASLETSLFAANNKAASLQAALHRST